MPIPSDTEERALDTATIGLGIVSTRFLVADLVLRDDASWGSVLGTVGVIGFLGIYGDRYARWRNQSS